MKLPTASWEGSACGVVGVKLTGRYLISARSCSSHVTFVVTFVVYFTTAVYHMSMDLPLLCIFATLSALFGWAYSATLTMLQGALQVEVAHPKARLPRRPF